MKTNLLSEPDPTEFRVGDVWESPRGTKYLMVDMKVGKIRRAVLREGANGTGRRMVRDWNATGNFWQGSMWIRLKCGQAIED